MYTTILQETMLQILRINLEKYRDKGTPIRIDDIMAFVKLDLNLAFLRRGGQILQTTLPLVTVASVPTRLSENPAILAVHNDHIQPLHDFLKTIHPNIRWTKEIENQTVLPCLMFIMIIMIHNPDG